MTMTVSALSSEAIEEGERRLAAVRTRIDAAAARAGRDPAEVTLVGVAKRQPVERILAAIAAGVRVIGQSYVQEAREMRPTIDAALAGDPVSKDWSLSWRLVGRLQRNKANHAARLFDAIESIDRPELVDALAKRARGEGRVLEALIQVSLCGEPQKGGCEPDAVRDLAARIRDAEGLALGGLMTVPAATADPEGARPIFRRLREIRSALAAEDPAMAKAALSMGMSADLEVAVEEGATLVRVGTALFGDRIGPPPAAGD